MRDHSQHLLLLIALFAASLSMTNECHGEVGDVLLSTDHPLYPGEGEFQTPTDCVRWATRNATTNHDRSLAIFRYLLTHQWHLHSPQEWNQPGSTPGKDQQNYEMVVYDANKGRFSYGYGLCGTVHAWNEPYWKAAGFLARRRAFPGHTNSEVLIDDRWRMFDTDMAGIVLDRSGQVVGYDEIANNVNLLDQQQGHPHYPFAWPSDFNTMKKGWQQIAKGGNWYRLYHGGYAAQPGVVHLRSGESFKRYAHPDGFGEPSKRRFWHQQKDGPYRTWTFAESELPFHNGDQSNCRGRARYGNAVFAYHPQLDNERCFEGMAEQTTNLTVSPNGLQSSDGKRATAIFEHFSPYVICGDPVDDTDPMLGKATDGFVVEIAKRGKVDIKLSVDQGQTWHAVEVNQDRERLDLTELTKGRYGWQVRLDIDADAAVTQIRFTTTCQMCQSIYPRLKPKGSVVTYRTNGQSVVPILPRLQDKDETETRFEKRDLRTDNLDFVGLSPKERYAYKTRRPKPAELVFRIPSRTPLVGVSAAARYRVRSPSPPHSRFWLDVSTDGGESWKPLGESSPPEDNEYSSGWVYGSSSWKSPESKEALVRVGLDGGGYGSALLAAELYGLRQTANDSPVTITYSWFEGDQERTDRWRVPPGQRSLSHQVPTGQTVRDNYVLIEVK